MKKIKIKSMSLLNFKGIRDMKIEFKDDLTTIAGRNGLGKTTIFDAFCWLLFDKNSDDKKAFNIKTLDENGVAIERIPHEVSAVIDVDGREVKISKSYKEKWVKQRGKAEEEFKGHDTECMWDDVPMKNGEFNNKIVDTICGESVFKTITSPSYFNSLKTESQRAFLFQMAGDVTDAQLCEGNESFAKLVEMMDGKSLEDFKRSIAAKKRAIKLEIDSLPARIDERKRDSAPEGDEAVVRASLEKYQKDLDEIDRQLSDVSAKFKASEEEVRKRSKAIFDIKCKIDKRKKDVELELNKDYYEQKSLNGMLMAEIEFGKNLISQSMERKAKLTEYIGTLEQKANELRAKWMEINSKQIVFNDSDFVCPTCKRPFDVADIESKKAEMLSNFNAEKVSLLTENMTQGKANKALIEAKKAEIANIDAEIAKAESTIKEKESQIVEVKQPDVQSVLDNDAELIKMTKELESFNAEPVPSAENPNAELLEKKKVCVEYIDAIKKRIAMYDSFKENAKRIAELEKMLTEQNQALADLEATEFTMQEFSKARINALEDKVNSMFTNVKFKMFAKQINGGEVETCEAMVDGVPFADLNNAGKINCGLDIIDGLIKKYEISAPIFVDNAEAVNELFSVPAQMVRLVVSEDEKLTIK